MVAAPESVKPQWRDPEYGHRLRGIHRGQRKRPDRPLVVVLGSSRAQMGVSPTAMEFPDEPGSPLVYNFGYRAGFPLVAALQLMRLFDEGIRPHAVVWMLSASEVIANLPADTPLEWWPLRFSEADLKRLAPYTDNPEPARRELSKARQKPWDLRREAVLSDLFTQWQLESIRWAHEGWERMDGYGYVTFPEERHTPAQREIVWRETVAAQPALINDYPLGAMTDRVIRDMVARCRAEGVAVAFMWAPESPAYRALYKPKGLAQVEAYTRVLTTEVGVIVFPAPTHLEEMEFADGYHLLPGGAARYSRWLSENHLKPWLAFLRREHP
jgi:hypothetical protein